MLQEEFDLDVGPAETAIDGLGSRFDSVVEAFQSSLQGALDEALGSLAIENVDASAVTDSVTTAIDEASATPVEVQANADALQSEVFAALEEIHGEVDVDANTAAAESRIADLEGLFSSAVFEVEVDADTGNAEAALTELGDTAAQTGEQASGAAGGMDQLGASSSGAAAFAGAATGEFSGLEGAIGKMTPAAQGAVGAVAALVAGTGVLISAGLEATSALERFESATGRFGDAVLSINVGSLNTDLRDLAIQVGTDDEALLNASTTLFQFGTNAGLSGEQAAEFSNQVAALAARAAVLNPALGSAADIIPLMSRGLATGGRFAQKFGLDLNKADIAARAATNASKGLGDGVSATSLQIAGAQLAVEKYGDKLGSDIEKGSQNAIIQQRRLTEEIQNFIEEAGKPLVAPFLELMKDIQPVVAAASQILTTFAGPVLVSLGAGLKALGPPLELVSSAFEAMAPVIQPVLLALQLLTNPLGLIAVAVQALDGPLRGVRDAIVSFGSAVADFLSPIADAAVAIGEFAASLGGPLLSALQGFGSGLLDGLIAPMRVLIEITRRVIDVFVSIGSTIGGAIGDLGIVESIVDGAVSAFESIVDVGESVIDVFKSIGSGIVAAAAVVGDAIGEIVGFIADVISELADTGGSIADVAGTVAGALGPIGAPVQAALNGIRDGFDNVRDSAQSTGEKARGAGTDLKGAGDAADEGGRKVKGAGDAAGQSAGFFDRLSDAVKNGTAGWAAALGAIDDYKAALDSVIGVQISASQAFDDSAGDLDKLQAAMFKAVDAGQGIGDVLTATTGPARDVRDAVRDAAGGFLDLAEKQLDAGAKIGPTNDALILQRQHLADLLASFGVAPESIGPFLDSLGLTEENLRNLAPPADDAGKKLDDVGEKAKGAGAKGKEGGDALAAGLTKSLKGAGDEAATAGRKLVDAAADATRGTGKMAEAGTALGNAFVQSLGTAATAATAAGLALVTAVSTGIRGTGLMAEAGTALSNAFVAAVQASSGGATLAGLALAQAVSNGVRGTGLMAEAGLALAQAFTAAVSGSAGVAQLAGLALAQAVSAGVRGTGLMAEAGLALGAALAAAIQSTAGLASAAGLALVTAAAAGSRGTGLMAEAGNAGGTAYTTAISSHSGAASAAGLALVSAAAAGTRNTGLMAEAGHAGGSAYTDAVGSHGGAAANAGASLVESAAGAMRNTGAFAAAGHAAGSAFAEALGSHAGQAAAAGRRIAQAAAEGAGNAGSPTEHLFTDIAASIADAFASELASRAALDQTEAAGREVGQTAAEAVLAGYKAAAERLGPEFESLRAELGQGTLGPGDSGSAGPQGIFAAVNADVARMLAAKGVTPVSGADAGAIQITNQVKIGAFSGTPADANALTDEIARATEASIRNIIRGRR